MSDLTADGLYKEAMSYLGDEGARSSTKKGIRLLLKAAEEGSVDAAFQVALRYREGNGLTQDFAKSQKWAAAAAEGGNPAGKVLYGESLLGEDDKEATRWLRSAYEDIKDSDNPEYTRYLGPVCLDLAELYLTETTLEVSCFFAKAAMDAGYEEAKGIYSLHLFEEDPDKAARLLIESAEDGNPHGAILLALTYIDNNDAEELLPDFPACLNYLIKYAEDEGNDKEARGYACYAAGICALKWDGKYQTAFEWFGKGAAIGNYDCQRMYERFDSMLFTGVF